VNDPSLTTPPEIPPYAPVSAAQAALTTAYKALAGTSMSGAALLVVDALGAADQLQAPGENTALRALVAKATGYSALYTQTCENGQHREWFAEIAEAVECPWCLNARLQATAGRIYRVERAGTVIGTYSSDEAAGAHADTELRRAYPSASTRWSPHPNDEAAVRLDLLVDDVFQPTAYSVTAVEVLAAYDPEADA
jgi:hypothetical protein